jgi:tetratricopeptide (TPR) repeat protein
MTEQTQTLTNLTLEEILESGRSQILAERREEKAEAIREARERLAEHKQAWSEFETAAKSLLPAALHPYLQFNRFYPDNDDLRLPGGWDERVRIELPKAAPVLVIFSRNPENSAWHIRSDSQVVPFLVAKLDRFAEFDPEHDARRPAFTFQNPSKHRQLGVALAVAQERWPEYEQAVREYQASVEQKPEPEADPVEYSPDQLFNAEQALQAALHWVDQGHNDRAAVLTQIAMAGALIAIARHMTE